jgi:hypothetical protein
MAFVGWHELATRGGKPYVHIDKRDSPEGAPTTSDPARVTCGGCLVWLAEQPRLAGETGLRATRTR